MTSVAGNNAGEPQIPVDSLSSVYKKMASRALQVPSWPDSATSNKLFRRNGSYVIPTFPITEAPLAVAALLDHNHSARRILKDCDRVFETFLSEIQIALSSSMHLTRNLERNVWRITPGTHHITVAVFQEHPSLLLDETDRGRWRPVQENVAEQVFSELSSHQQNNDRLMAPMLQLDSLLITGDGVMIAGFVDRLESFQKIRLSCLEIARSVIGELTSRPKKLMHVTLGRVLAMPDGINVNEQQAVNELVRTYNTRILPEKVVSMRKSLPDDASFWLTEVTMIRDVVWMLREIKYYGSWSFVRSGEANGKM